MMRARLCLLGSAAGLACLGVAAAVAPFVLAGCGGPSPDPTADGGEEVIEVVDREDDASSDAGSDASSDTSSDAAPVGGEEATDDAGGAGTYEVGEFTFQLPASWVGRVSVEVDEEAHRASITLPGNPDAPLATLVLAEGDEPEVMGDIGSHVAGSVSSGSGTHVEVWSTNWPWFAANEPEGIGVGEDELAELVDLSTGGLLSLDSLAQESDETIDGAEYGFVNAELVSTVAFG